MSALPVLLVFKSEPPAHLCEALAKAGRAAVRRSGNEAAKEIRAGQLLLCDRIAGWQALVVRVDAAGGASVLVGEPPRAEELPHLLPADLISAQTPEEVLAALVSAEDALRIRADPHHLDRSLLERAQSAELVSRFAQSIATQIELPHVIREAMQRTRELCEADGAALLLIDAKTGELCFDTVSGGAGGTIQEIRLRPGQGIAGKVATRAEPMLIRDARTHPDVEHSVGDNAGFNTASLIAVPMLFSGDVIGVLEAVRGKGSEPFEEAHLRRLLDLAPHVTIAVHNARMTTQLMESQTLVLRANADLERKVQERTQQIARGKREWERTFDAISEPIALLEGFTVKRANLAYARRVGVTIVEVPGKRCFELLAGRTEPCEGCPLLAREKDKELSGEVTIKDHAYVLAGFGMSSESGEDGVVVHYRDVTGQKLLERRLRETERLAALGQLASGAAHEINNPLGFLTSNLRSLDGHLRELAELTGQGEEVKTLIADGAEMIAESLEGARRVAEIVRGLRELAKLEIGRCEPTPVNPSITRAVRAELADLKAELSLESLAPVEVPPLQLDQVLGHLLRNARQALGAKGQIRVRTYDTADEVRIDVEDSGCGIPKDIQHRIFEPFFTTRGVGKGIGLGLTAAYGIVKRYGGEIGVRSVVGEGSVFTIRLPKAATDEKRSQSAA